MDMGTNLRFVMMCSILSIAFSKCLQEHPLSISCIGEGYDAVPNDLPKNIRTLNLSHNNISHLTADTLKLYSHVTVFNLNYNEISSTNNMKAVAVMEKLKEIYLSGNDLHHFDFHVFSYNDHLNKIVANDNPHISIKEKPVYLKHIKTVSLQKNRLINFPSTALQGFPNLEVLDLSENGLKVVPENLEDTFSKLQVLILFHNPLTHVDQVLLPKKYLMITSGTEYTDKSRVIRKSVDYTDAEIPDEPQNDTTIFTEILMYENIDQNVSDSTKRLAEIRLRNALNSKDGVVVVVGVILVVFLIVSVIFYFFIITRTAYKAQQQYEYLNNNAS